MISHQIFSIEWETFTNKYQIFKKKFLNNSERSLPCKYYSQQGKIFMRYLCLPRCDFYWYQWRAILSWSIEITMVNVGCKSHNVQFYVSTTLSLGKTEKIYPLIKFKRGNGTRKLLQVEWSGSIGGGRNLMSRFHKKKKYIFSLYFLFFKTWTVCVGTWCVCVCLHFGIKVHAYFMRESKFTKIKSQ